MRTYKLELRHAPSKNTLNATRANRLPPITARLSSDDSAITWARDELIGMARRERGDRYQYVEASIFELYPIGSPRQDDNRRLGRWVINFDGLHWRPTAAWVRA
ncbi:MAG TPA: hypothetical protein VHX64_12830 [Caulobacteraceae bacterium]|nr:hypothetical protein [Caulobacteraceae bacterium]